MYHVCERISNTHCLILPLLASSSSSLERSFRSGSSRNHSASSLLALSAFNLASKGESRSCGSGKRSSSDHLLEHGVSCRSFCPKFLRPLSGPRSQVWPTSWVTWSPQLRPRSKPVSTLSFETRLFRSSPSFLSWWRTLAHHNPRAGWPGGCAKLRTHPGHLHRIRVRLHHCPRPDRP